MANIPELLNGHVTLEVECLDRLYLNGYIGPLATVGGLVTFMREQYYFYIDDADFGPLFLKVCSYAPWGTKLCLNGHEWAKRQLDKQGIGYEALDNGFLSCAEPEKLQQICDSLGPEEIDRLFRKWLKRLPLPLRAQDRAAGYDWSLSIWQLEVSLTQIFDRPLRGREFFEEIIRDNLDLGRPDRVPLIFDRVVTKKTPGEFRTRVIQEGVPPSLHIQYKNFDLKQYFKEGRGCRTEGTFRNPNDFGINKGLNNLPYLRKIGREINRRLLEVERVSHKRSKLSGHSPAWRYCASALECGNSPGLRSSTPR